MNRSPAASIANPIGLRAGRVVHNGLCASIGRNLEDLTVVAGDKQIANSIHGYSQLGAEAADPDYALRVATTCWQPKLLQPAGTFSTSFKLLSAM